MRVTFLGPFDTRRVSPYINSVKGRELPLGTGGYALSNLVIERARRGLASDVITMDRTLRKDCEFWEGENVRLWVVKRRKGAFADLFHDEIKTIHRIIESSSSDVVNAHWTYEYGLASILQGKIPSIVTVHDNTYAMLRYDGVPYLPFFAIAHYVMYRSNHIVAVSPYVGSHIPWARKKDVTVIPNVLPDFIWEVPNSRSYSGGELTLFSSLNLGRHKNLTRALYAFQLAREQLLKKSVRLTYTITGVSYEMLPGALRKDHKLLGSVDFKGKLGHRENILLMAKSDVVLHPSLEESFGFPVAESLALRKPVVAAIQSAGSCWLLNKGEFGNLVEGNNVKAVSYGIISAVEKLLSDKYDTLAGYNAIKKLTDPNIVLREYEKVYSSAIRARR